MTLKVVFLVIYTITIIFFTVVSFVYSSTFGLDFTRLGSISRENLIQYLSSFGWIYAIYILNYLLIIQENLKSKLFDNFIKIIMHLQLICLIIVSAISFLVINFVYVVNIIGRESPSVHPFKDLLVFLIIWGLTTGLAYLNFKIIRGLNRKVSVIG